ncbi:ribokinase [Variovorax paradoxus]|uniref:Ribokinase n=1 Tax=Variovorax paradoxus TaxID=34073 RepID=A0AAE3Y087_VARPD|nr:MULTISPECIES: ribokinase [Variovorax]MBD9662441.1 ribokinase [Variovorax sp. VRV01]MDR6426936.1 ribokinase [Variovorax paradoxus]MDR6450843.1 ribokinase [Variovorax paradoxus]
MSSKPSPSSSAAQPPRIVVLGSLNMDIVLRVPHAPAAGETLLGHSIAHIPGGKGANQAVSCAREGARVAMIGCVGADAHGQALRGALMCDGIDTAALRTSRSEPTGTALILVEDSGQNRIVMIPGANAQAEIDAAALRQQLQGAAFLVTQFEIPMDQVARAISVAHEAGCRVLLNPSPVQPIAEPLWPRIDTLVVNEIEAEALCGQAADSPQEAALAGQALRAKGVARVVVTLGARGAVAIDADGARHHPAPRVQAVDTTAAGDTFLGALAVALGEGQSFDEAVRLGIRAAALCIQRPGAQPSIPQRDAVLQSPMPPDWTAL